VEVAFLGADAGHEERQLRAGLADGGDVVRVRGADDEADVAVPVPLEGTAGDRQVKRPAPGLIGNVEILEVSSAGV